MKKINIGITKDHLASLVQILNSLLADEYVLYTKTRNFHWNVTGINFQELHKFFEAQYDELNIMIDDFAERVRALGGVASGSLAEFIKNARLPEVKGELLDATTMISMLLDDHEAMIRQLRIDVEISSNQNKDAGTSDFLTGIMEQHEKIAWMLRSLLV